MIPFGDLKRQYSEKIERAVIEHMKQGWFVLGASLASFEKKFAEYCGRKYGVGVGNGTDALFLSLRALNIGRGDEVITVPNTAIPTIAAIRATGAVPRLVDIRDDYLIDVSKLEKSITPKTKAIVPVHLYGQACDMHPLLKIANKHSLEVIEDCAQAHGTKYKGKKVPISGIGCFSFYPSKNLGAFGDGGMIVTDRKDFEETLRLIRNYGQSDKYHAKIDGYNSRLDDLQAVILEAKLSLLDEWNGRRRKIAQFYNSALNGIVKTPLENDENFHIYHLYVIRTQRRDELREYLKNVGIGTEIHYPIPLHLQEAYKNLGYTPDSFLKSEEFSKEILSLPVYPELTDEEVSIVAEKIKGFFGNK